jgi:hypothetical protein
LALKLDFCEQMARKIKVAITNN